MSNGSSENFRDRSHSWDHPNGLGWQVWRRAQSTGLLTQPIQRDLARFRANTLRNPAPLVSDIRRRWRVGENTSVYRFGLDLPLFLGWVPPYRSGTSHHLSVAGSEAARRITDTSRNFLPHEKSRFSVTATLVGSPSPAADTQKPAEAIVPRSASESEDTVVNSVARRAEPSASSLEEKQSEWNSSNFALTTLRESPLPQKFITTVQTFPLNSRTELLSSAIIHRYKSIPAAVQKSSRRFSRTEESISTLLQPVYETSELLKTSPRHRAFSTTTNNFPSVPDVSARGATDAGGERRTSGQDSTIAMAQPRDYQAGITPRSNSLQPTNLVLELKEGTISRTVLSKPSVVGSTPERTALTRNHDITISRVDGMLTPQRNRVAAETTLTGRVMASVISRGSGTHSPVEVMLPPLTVTRHRFEQPFSLYKSSLSPTFGPREFVSTLHRATYVPAPGSEFAPHTEEVGARFGTSPSGAPATESRLTNPTASQITRIGSRLFAAGAHETPGLPALSDDRGISNFPDAHGMPVVTTSRTAISMSAVAMPLSTPSVLRRAESMAGGPEQRFFSQRAVPVALTVSRAESPGFSSSSEAARGNALGVDLIDTYAGRRETLQTNEGSGSNLVFGPVASRVVVESGRISNDATETSVTNSPSQSFDGERHPKETHYPQSMEGSITPETVAATGFGTLSVYGDIGRPRLPLMTHRRGLFLGGFPAVKNSVWRAVERLGAPLSLTRTAVSRTAVGNQLPWIAKAPGIGQSTELISARWSHGMSVEESSTIFPRSEAAVPMVMSMWSGTMTAPAVLRRSHAFANQGQYAASPAIRGTAHDMPFVVRPTTAGEGGLMAAHRNNGTSIQTVPQGSVPAVTGALPIGGQGESLAVDKSTAPAAQIDLDEVVEKAWQKLLLKLTIEQERRGYSRWS